MNKSQLKTYRKSLLEKKENLERSIKDKGAKTVSPGTDGHGDFADRSSAANEEEISIQLKQTDVKLLRAIEDALARVDLGNYGVCVDCEEEITDARLKAVPWTKVCLSCKEKQYS